MRDRRHSNAGSGFRNLPLGQEQTVSGAAERGLATDPVPLELMISHTVDAARSNVIEVVFDNYLSFASPGNRRIGPFVLRGVIEMRPSQLANKNGLARAGETGLKEPSPGPHPLAGFDVTAEDCPCILPRNSRESMRARWAPNATERTQPMLEFVWPRKANPQWRHSFVSTGFRLTIFRE